jgi:hypothetical protein
MQHMQAVCIMKSRVECDPQELDVFQSLTSTVPIAEILLSLQLRLFEKKSYSHIKLDFEVLHINNFLHTSVVSYYYK